MHIDCISMFYYITMLVYLFTSPEDLPEVLALALVEVVDHVSSLSKTSKI